MKKYYILFLLSILMNVGVVSAQNVDLENCSVKSRLMKTYDPLNKKFQNGEAIDLGVSAGSNNKFAIGVYLSFDKTLDTLKDKLIAHQEFQSGSFTALIPYTIPCDNYTYTGKLYVFFYGDYQNKIAETNETDNILMDTIEIKNSYPCGLEISNVKTGEVLSGNYFMTKTSYSSFEFLYNNGISGEFKYSNYTIANLSFNKTAIDQLSYYISTEAYFDEKSAIQLLNPYNPSYNKDTILSSMSTTTFKINNLKYDKFFNNNKPFDEGYYYLYAVSKQYQRCCNLYDKGLVAIGRSSLLKLGDFTGNINNDFNINLPQNLTLNTPYSVILSQYQKGRETRYGSTPICFTNKSEQNTVDFFVKFKATNSIMSLTLSADDVSLESAVELTTSPKTCINNVQSGSKLRYYTFDNLTVGNFYTARVEYGGNAQIGFARTDASSATSVTLSEGGITTGIESNTNNNVVSIYPNPSNDGKFTISSTQIISKIKVSNALGESEIFNNTNDFKTSLKGLLFVEVTDENGNSSVSKVVVE